MSATPSPQRVEHALRRLAQLRTLFRRLPHLPSSREVLGIAEFDAFLAGSRTTCSHEALDAGVRAAFRRADAGSILLAAERLATLREDPELHPYFYWAQRASRDSTLAARSAESPRE